jgi:hypothetical protein
MWHLTRTVTPTAFGLKSKMRRVQCESVEIELTLMMLGTCRTSSFATKV